MGSARLLSADAAEAALTPVELSAYNEAARELAHQLTLCSKGLDRKDRRFVICTGGGPGIMEAANRGAAEAECRPYHLDSKRRIRQSLD